MKLPGFTAEKSLARNPSLTWHAESSAAPALEGVVPQLWCSWRGSGFVCCAWGYCLWCDPSPVGCILVPERWFALQ